MAFGLKGLILGLSKLTWWKQNIDYFFHFQICFSPYFPVNGITIHYPCSSTSQKSTQCLDSSLIPHIQSVSKFYSFSFLLGETFFFGSWASLYILFVPRIWRPWLLFTWVISQDYVCSKQPWGMMHCFPWIWRAGLLPACHESIWFPKLSASLLKQSTACWDIHGSNKKMDRFF